MRAREFITESSSLVAAIKRQFPDQAEVVDLWNNWAVTAFKQNDESYWYIPDNLKDRVEEISGINAA